MRKAEERAEIAASGKITVCVYDGYRFVEKRQLVAEFVKVGPNGGGDVDGERLVVTRPNGSRLMVGQYVGGVPVVGLADLRPTKPRRFRRF